MFGDVELWGMNLSELRTFLTIVETGSLVRASERLHVTQSTVTARLKSLEEELGQILINRQKSGATLTAAGQRLHRYASTISDLWRQARQETALPDAMSATCNMACHPDLWPGLGQVMFDHIRESLPQVALSVWQGGEQDMAGWLSGGLADVAFSYWPTVGAGQKAIELAVDELILVSTKADGPVRFDPGYVYVEAGDAFGRDHAVAYADAGTARLSFGTAELGLAHLLAHGGSAYLPRRVAARELEAGRLYWLEDGPVFERRSYLVVNESAVASWPWFEGCLEVVRGGDR